MVRTGSNKVQVGDFVVWSINDGYLDIDQKCFANIEPDALRQMLIQMHVQCVRDLVVRTQVHGYLIQTKEHLILVDAGSGIELEDTAGHLMQSIGQVGFTPEQISLVLITHLHPDHMGGLLTAEGAKAFPNATVYVSAIDANYWRDSVEEAKVNYEGNRPWFGLARKMLAPYESSGNLRLIKSGESVVSGITAVEAYGHTPGHMGFLLNSKNKHMLLWGDIVHTAGLQFKHPEWYLVVDSDGKQGVESRKRLFAKAADEHLLVGGAHLPASGMGFVVRKGDVFAWESLKN